MTGGKLFSHLIKRNATVTGNVIINSLHEDMYRRALTKSYWNLFADGTIL